MSGLTERAARHGGAAAHTRKRLAAATAAVLITTGGAALILTQPATAASGCQVSYTANSWPGGFTASISVTNLGSAVTSWTLAFTLPGNEAVSQGWSANYSQSGQNVTATNVSYNGSLGTNGNTSFGFNGSYSAASFPGNPTSFSLNGTACTGAVSSSPTPTPSATTSTPTPTPTPTSSSGYLYEDSGQWAQYSIGGYTIYNDEWGSGHNTQTLWVKSATNWGVFSTQPSTSGVKSYANISKSIGTALNSLSSATSTFNESNPSGGNWESAYDIWLNGSGIEVMVWTDVSGNVGPLGSSVGTVTLDGNTWTLFAGNNGSNPTYSFVRSANETSGTVNILDLLKYLENTKGYFSNPTLSTIQYGWEISGTNNAQENFTINNYSASAS